MMDTGTLFDLVDVTPAWEPIYNEPGRCRDCGREHSFNQGGARPGLGLFSVCNDCAPLDACDRREARHPEDVVPGTRISHWGSRVSLDEHARLTELQRRRRHAHTRRRNTEPSRSVSPER